jgi:hypothetical protein
MLKTFNDLRVQLTKMRKVVEQLLKDLKDRPTNLSDAAAPEGWTKYDDDDTADEQWKHHNQVRYDTLGAHRSGGAKGRDSGDQEQRRSPSRSQSSQSSFNLALQQSASVSPDGDTMSDGDEDLNATFSSISSTVMDQPWLSSFGVFSIASPSKARFDARKWQQLVGELPILRQLVAKQVLDFVEALQIIFGVIPDGAVPWVQVVDRSVRPMIVRTFSQVFGTTTRSISDNLMEISGKEMVVILGRICETSSWESFKGKLRYLFADCSWDRKAFTDTLAVWQQLHAVLQRIALVVPLFGRRLGEHGVNLYERDSHLSELLHECKVPGDLLKPLLDRLYSPAHRAANQKAGLEAQPSKWRWDQLNNVLLLLGEHVSDLAEQHRQAEDMSAEFNRFLQRSSVSVKVHSLAQDEDVSALVSEDERVVSAYTGRVASSKAYGASGYGVAAPKLEQVVKRSVDQLRDGPDICFAFALTGSCSRGEGCNFAHPDLEKLDPVMAKKLVNFLRQRAEKPNHKSDQGGRPKFHGIAAELELEASVDPALEAVSALHLE